MDGEIDVRELAELLETDGDVRVVDIRDERAFRRGHVPGSECIPFPELTTRVAELDGADRVVTVCPHGIASRQAAELVGSYAGSADARVESLRGGIEAWERERGLTASESANATSTTDETRGTEPTGTPGAEPDEGPDAPF